ncbi:MAG: hypothetical protein A2Y57_03995 [Candidatus Woykebacteria bacterium RBG_13_40_7b]|uniref:Type II secretion system protein GspG C-terminal domain-containing protein n=1 Tax=Candidatus Woykebacteria bacterium RBG_13_40_7b TaxID=1802594 RepID=A0A1G1W7J1_9BACT|nr:MAG: hypothetical protein A2Y57_03995 [Candidatus Woykebacteria bacterium RBG_13_40_7b]
MNLRDDKDDEGLKMKDERFIIKEEGLTLIELLVVIGVIAGLLTLAAVTFITVQTRSRDGERKSDLSKIQVALEQYFSDQKSYPSSGLTAGNPLTDCTGAVCTPTKTYLEKIPGDPKSGNYNYSLSGTTYTIYACLENTKDSDRDDVDGGPQDSCGADGRVSYTVSSTNP